MEVMLMQQKIGLKLCRESWQIVFSRVSYVTGKSSSLSFFFSMRLEIVYKLIICLIFFKKNKGLLPVAFFQARALPKVMELWVVLWLYDPLFLVLIVAHLFNNKIYRYMRNIPLSPSIPLIKAMALKYVSFSAVKDFFSWNYVGSFWMDKWCLTLDCKDLRYSAGGS